MIKRTCCFIGHRTINETEELKTQLYEIIEKLIVNDNVDTFLFGSKSQFNSLCHRIVTKIKEKYPYIKRVYVRAEHPFISDSYKAYLLENYEQTYYPEHIIGSGRATYVERNIEMIDKSSFCIVYFSEEYLPKNRKSGTGIALNYAKKKNKNVIILP